MKHGLVASAVIAVALSCGCSALNMRSQSPEDEIAESADKRQLVGDCATAFGLYPVKVEAVGLVTGLPLLWMATRRRPKKEP